MAAKENEKMTIEQVAEALGVSKTTVSRALSGKGRISEKTRAKVFAYMGHARTEPASAQKDPKVRTNNIAMVVPQRFITLDLPFLRRRRLCAGMPHIGEHLGAGFLADAPFSGKCAGHRCFGNAQRLRHLLDSHFFVFFCGHWGNLLLCIALRNKSHISITGYSFVVNVRKQQKAFCFLAER
jgi:hypothetical protein